MGFLLTLFLCTVNILNSTASNTPKSGGDATAIIQWIMWCLLFIIMAILEYAMILAYKKFKRIAVNFEDICMQCHDNTTENLLKIPKTEVAIIQKAKLSAFFRRTVLHDHAASQLIKKIDILMAIMCPVSFTIFTVAFWSHFSYWKLLSIHVFTVHTYTSKATIDGTVVKRMTFFPLPIYRKTLRGIGFALKHG